MSSKHDLFTVTMRRAMPITTTTGTRTEDIVEIFHNMSWADACGLRKKFSNVEDITVQQTSGGKRSSKPDYQLAIGDKVTKARSEGPAAPVRRTGKRKPSHPTIPAHDLGSLVTVMAEKEAV